MARRHVFWIRFASRDYWLAGAIYVHFSADEEMVIRVSGRQGQPVVLVIQAEKMCQVVSLFYRSANGAR